LINKHSVPLSGFRAFGGQIVDKLFTQRLLVTTVLAAMLAGVTIGEGLRPFAIPFFIAIAPTNPILAAIGIVIGHIAAGGTGTFWLILPLVPIYLIRIRAPTLNSAALLLLAAAGQLMFRLPHIPIHLWR